MLKLHYLNNFLQFIHHNPRNSNSIFIDNPNFLFLIKEALMFAALVEGGVTWKRLNTETTQHGNASKKQNHKTNLMSSSLNLKLKRLYSSDFHRFPCHRAY